MSTIDLSLTDLLLNQDSQTIPRLRNIEGLQFFIQEKWKELDEKRNNMLEMIDGKNMVWKIFFNQFCISILSIVNF